MSYTPQQWADGDITAPNGPLSGARLDHMEDGIDTAHDAIDTNAAAILVAKQQVVTFGRASALLVVNGQGRFGFPFPATIVSVTARVSTVPTGSSILVDVNKNGVTIFTTQANRPAIAASTNATASPAVPDVTSVVAGDYLTVDIDQVGSTIAGADLTVEVLYIVTG